jgi:hypothetical protein
VGVNKKNGMTLLDRTKKKDKCKLISQRALKRKWESANREIINWQRTLKQKGVNEGWLFYERH